jgi:predicted permease
MNFFITLSAVAIMLLYALPGFLLVKAKAVPASGIPYFSKLLLFVCQPCLTFNSLVKMPFSRESVINLLICFVLTLGFQGVLMLLYFLLFKKKRGDIKWRIVNLAAIFSNCGYLGVPLLEELLPEHPEVAAYSCIFALTMHMIGWSAGLYILSLDKKFISPKKILINPATLALLVALPFFIFDLSLPSGLSEMIAVLAKTSTPLCMIIMGMRLAKANLKDIFANKLHYLAVLLNQIVFPLFAFAIMFFLPIDQALKATIVILSACPVASMVQNYAELLGKGQDTAANTVLLGTLLSVFSVPLICLLL